MSVVMSSPTKRTVSPVFKTENASPKKILRELTTNVVVGNSVNLPIQLQVKKLSDQAFLPTRGSKYAAGYDLYAAYDGVVPARGKALVRILICLV